MHIWLLCGAGEAAEVPQGDAAEPVVAPEPSHTPDLPVPPVAVAVAPPETEAAVAAELLLRGDPAVRCGASVPHA